LAEVATPGPAAFPAGNDPELATTLYEMWSVLLPAPLWDKVRRSQEVIVVPDAALCQLPFEALVVETPQAKSTPRYWLDAGPIVHYALSGMSLVGSGAAAATSSAASSQAGLSVSDPAYAAKGPFEALPATGRETAAIQAAFEPARLTILQGQDATEARVRAALSGKRYVHLATHGIVDRRHSELLSGLALTPPSTPTRDTSADGLLQLFEIYDLHLDCDLAVLSACETSAGTWVEGEGVYALSRGFLAAGAKQVVASLWSVEDESTAALVGDLFRDIAPAKSKDRKTDLEVARALRDAKRRIRDRQEWSAPFYWAPFVLTTRQ
jgi:CHAT domain-containing protein